MSTQNEESITKRVEQLRKASTVFLILAWLVWVEFAAGCRQSFARKRWLWSDF